ncbi:pathogenesis-related homeodomain protein [Rutidosis leptorrhynchoides]|uniref:pathogenesis-related homeodomain protein n=1 Tax=Rutidosis leptorrhynchoides TaxID=125765 RepID=UPI003A99D7B8
MPGTGEKNASFSKTENESDLISSFKLKKGKPNSKSNFKTIGSILSKGKVTDSSSKRTKNESTNRKSVSRKIVHKALETKSSMKRASSKHRCKKSTVDDSEVNTKNVDGDVETRKVRKRKKRKTQKPVLDDASRLQRRTRYLLIKMKLQQNLIDAYSADGWKGQSREKIKPEKELQRAKKQILECKLGLRDAIRQLESLSSAGSMEGSVISPDGSVHHEQIFCAKCKLREAFPDNDIILCDGTCNRAFHQKCLDPPLETENIPPEDEGWFCKFCDCKMEIIDKMNAHIGTCYTDDCSWQDIFKEEAALPEGGNSYLNTEEDWPSDDSADVDYNPEKKANNCSISGAVTDDDEDDASDSGSTSLSWSSNTNMYSGSGTSYRNHSVNSSENSDGEIIHGRRQRRAVDYNKLYDEMFGKDGVAPEQISEDEDWGPVKKNRREKESDAVSTIVTLFDTEKKTQNVAKNERKKNVSSDHKTRKPFSRIPPHAVEKLRQVFAENELPSRIVRENLSKELGLQPEKVNKWFKNSRYMALKIRKTGGAELPSSTNSRISEDPGSEHLEKRSGNAVLLEVNEKELETNGQSNDSNTLTTKLKKNQHITAALAANSNKVYLALKGILAFQFVPVGTKLSDDASLKKPPKVKLKKEKKKKEKVVDRDESPEDEAEAAMERLCRAKFRLEGMQQAISRTLTARSKKSKKSLQEGVVVYVPIAELREKA